MTTTTLTRGQKAAATRAANVEAQLREEIGPVPVKPGFHGFVCPSCKAKAEVITASATVAHRCAHRRQETVQFVYVGKGVKT